MNLALIMCNKLNPRGYKPHSPNFSKVIYTPVCGVERAVLRLINCSYNMEDFPVGEDWCAMPTYQVYVRANLFMVA